MALELHAAVEVADTTEVARMFARAGWTMRKSGWREYEVTTDGTELVIESQSPVLVHGSADSGGFRKTVELFRANKLRYQAELYDDSTLIVQEHA